MKVYEYEKSRGGYVKRDKRNQKESKKTFFI